MDPNQQPYQSPVPTPPPSNPYDFITNPGEKPKKSLLPGGSFVQRIVIVIGGAVLLMIIASVAISLLGGSGSNVDDSLKKLAAQQEEIIRIADEGIHSSEDQATLSFTTTTKLSVASQQQKLNGVLGDRDIKLTKLELAAELDPDLEKTLEAATSSNRFDEVFNAKLKQEVTEYAQLLQSTYNTSKSEKIKTVLSESYTSATLLLGL